MTRAMLTLCAAGLSACVAQEAPVAGRSLAAQALPVSVGARAFLASIVPGGTAGVTLTRVGAVPVAGASVRISGRDLGRDQGIIAKEAAMAACTRQGGVFQPQAIGRYPAQGTWVFDGACA